MKKNLKEWNSRRLKDVRGKGVVTEVVQCVTRCCPHYKEDNRRICQPVKRTTSSNARRKRRRRRRTGIR
ncbi:hypothetical protein ElyMa_005533300 [Elysia marginata]|uniref:Uncharacterized protein n=1 Tax=Elysia marginata TaxID=1093978 RepID=A0AAV4EX88_9GAST|nr:hypothetical protein ElyMa_005533300 [Elysia marginata]